MPDVNYLAVLVSGLAAFVVGMLWYSPVLFGDLWMKLANVKKTKPSSGEMAVLSLLGLVLALVTAFVLAHFIAAIGAVGPAEGAEVAFWAWLGFVATKFAGRVLWEGVSFKLFLINGAYELVVMLAMGVILGAW